MELSFTRTGSGRSLVLVHGITENRATWDPFIEPLSETFDVLAVDLRGHGRSPKGDSYDPAALAGDVRDTVAASGLTDGHEGTGPLVIGHSLGSVVATFYAATYPTRGAINVDQSLRLAGFKAGLTQLEPMLRGDTQSFEQALAMIFSSLAGSLSPDAAARVQSIRRPDQQVVLGIWSSVLELTTEQLDELTEGLLAGVTVPYLAIHGGDPGEGYVDWLTSLVPGATVEIWPDLGHYPHLVEPGRFVSRVRDFDAAL